MTKQLTAEETKEWLDGLAQFDEQNTVVFLAILAALGMKRAYLDVGSGTGAMVKAAHALGLDARGVDLLPVEHPLLFRHDLREPLDLGRGFDFVTSIETAEHIEPEFADVYVDSVARHLAHRGVLVFTAAMPGQPGHGHVNTAPAFYWREKFDKRGLTYRADLTYRIALALTTAHHSSHHIEANLQVFTRG